MQKYYGEFLPQVFQTFLLVWFISQPDYSKCQTYLPGSGKLVPCLLNYLDEISLKNLQCASYLREFAGLIYADYR